MSAFIRLVIKIEITNEPSRDGYPIGKEISQKSISDADFFVNEKV